MGATILNGAEIGEESIVAAGTLVPEGMKIPPRSLVMGLPAKVRREVTEQEKASLRVYANNYLEYKETYLQETAPPLPGPTTRA
jgi:carbonic anhydrase/acetyltransferase-like protein (isoleucine patch superfamily)